MSLDNDKCSLGDTNIHGWEPQIYTTYKALNNVALSPVQLLIFFLLVMLGHCLWHLFHRSKFCSRSITCQLLHGPFLRFSNTQNCLQQNTWLPLLSVSSLPFIFQLLHLSFCVHHNSLDIYFSSSFEWNTRHYTWNIWSIIHFNELNHFIIFLMEKSCIPPIPCAILSPCTQRSTYAVFPFEPSLFLMALSFLSTSNLQPPSKAVSSPASLPLTPSLIAPCLAVLQSRKATRKLSSPGSLGLSEAKLALEQSLQSMLPTLPS